MPTDDLRVLLDIEEIDRDLYRAPPIEGTRLHLFGGQVAAQALWAALLTVEPDRRPHSLHGYFLRRGTTERSVVLQVHRDRDGGSFSSRRILAVQDGEVLFSGAASFHRHDEGAQFQLPMPTDAPEPADLTPGAAMGGPTQFFEILGVPGQERGGRHFTRRIWTRTRVALPDDPGVHACALAYATDFGTGFAELKLDGLAPAGPSLDHCIWFHEPIRLDDWVLLDLWPLRASGGRGTYMGAVHDRAGELGCILAQEALLRPRGSVPEGS